MPAQHPKRQVGKASNYSKSYAGRKMANGRRKNTTNNNTTNKTQPQNTHTHKTNHVNGRSAVVTIEDRGPHVPGRIVDLSPATAGQSGLTHKQGLAKVEVVPIAEE